MEKHHDQCDRDELNMPILTALHVGAPSTNRRHSSTRASSCAGRREGFPVICFSLSLRPTIAVDVVGCGTYAAQAKVASLWPEDRRDGRWLEAFEWFRESRRRVAEIERVRENEVDRLVQSNYA